MLSVLTDAELLREFDNTDPLGTTEMGRELAKRLLEHLIGSGSLQAVTDVLDDHGIDPQDPNDVTKLETLLGLPDASGMTAAELRQVADELCSREINHPDFLRDALDVSEAAITARSELETLVATLQPKKEVTNVPDDDHPARPSPTVGRDGRAQLGAVASRTRRR